MKILVRQIIHNLNSTKARDELVANKCTTAVQQRIKYTTVASSFFDDVFPHQHQNKCDSIA